MHRTRLLVLLSGVLLVSGFCHAQTATGETLMLNLPRQSQHAVILQRIGITDITINYHRPLANESESEALFSLQRSYDSRWAIQWQKHNHEYDPVQELISYYRPLHTISQSIDVIPPTDPLSQYKLVVAPGLNVLSDAAAKNLIDYVRQGGHLVFGQRSAMKNDDNGLQTERQPGPLVELLGGRVEQYYALLDPVPVAGRFGSSQCKLWAELLSANSPDTEVLATYGPSNGWLAASPPPSRAKWVRAGSPILVCGSTTRAWQPRRSG